MLSDNELPVYRHLNIMVTNLRLPSSPHRISCSVTLLKRENQEQALIQSRRFRNLPQNVPKQDCLNLTLLALINILLRQVKICFSDSQQMFLCNPSQSCLLKYQYEFKMIKLRRASNDAPTKGIMPEYRFLCNGEGKLHWLPKLPR